MTLVVTLFLTCQFFILVIGATSADHFICAMSKPALPPLTWECLVRATGRPRRFALLGRSTWLYPGHELGLVERDLEKGTLVQRLLCAARHAKCRDRLLIQLATDLNTRLYCSGLKCPLPRWRRRSNGGFIACANGRNWPTVAGCGLRSFGPKAAIPEFLHYLMICGEAIERANCHTV